MKAYRTLLAASAAMAFVATGTAAIGSPGSGVTFTTLTVQPSLEPEHMNSDRIKFETKDATTVRMQSAAWAANSTSGWHHHPGVIFGVVTSGSITIWDGACNQTTYGPGLPHGSVFLEGDNMIMQATSSGGGSEYVTHFVPFSATPVYRFEDDPPGCASALNFRTPPR